MSSWSNAIASIRRSRRPACAVYVLALAHVALLGSHAVAATPPESKNASADAKNAVTAIPNDIANYIGDRVSFDRDLIVSVEGADGRVHGIACLPRRSRLRGGTAYVVSKGGDVKPETGVRFYTTHPITIAGDPFRLWATITKSDKANTVSDQNTCGVNAKTLAKDVATAANAPDRTDDIYKSLSNANEATEVLLVSSDQLATSPPNRYGLTYGALVVPFKYHLSGNRDVTSNASLGPYLGYRADRSSRGLGLSYVLFLGAGNTSVSVSSSATTAGGSTLATGTQSLFALSYGGGVVATIKGAFQAGLVFGKDHVNKSANYEYNDKLWVAAELGYSFLN